jgi:hypothetical protein
VKKRQAQTVDCFRLAEAIRIAISALNGFVRIQRVAMDFGCDYYLEVVIGRRAYALDKLVGLYRDTVVALTYDQAGCLGNGEAGIKAVWNLYYRAIDRRLGTIPVTVSVDERRRGRLDDLLKKVRSVDDLFVIKTRLLVLTDGPPQTNPTIAEHTLREILGTAKLRRLYRSALVRKVS